MKFRNLFIIFSLLTVSLIGGIIFSCSSTDPAASINCDGVSVDFATEVNPIIQASCATNTSCHSSGSRNGPGALVTYAQIFSVRNSIRSSVANGSMPRNSSLSSDQRNKIVCWINNGAQQ